MKYPIPKQRPYRPVQTFGRPVQNAHGQALQPSFMDRLGELSPALLQSGIGLMSGRTASEQFALGAQGFGRGIQDVKDKRETAAKKNKTLQFLRQQNPELAAAVEAGAIPASEAFGMHWRSQTGKHGEDFDAYGFPRSGAISQKLRAFKMQGIDDEKALGLATGRYSVSINPQTGERVIVDVASGQLMPLQQPQTQAQVAQQPGQAAMPRANPQTGLYDQADKATGVGSTLGNASSNTIGQIPGTIGDVASFPETVKAGQDFDLFKRDLIRSLSLNPRFPVAEMRRIEDLLPRGPFTAPDTLKQALTSLDAELARIESELSVSVNNPNTPIQLRQQDATTLRGVRAARQRMAVPQSGDVGSATASQGGADLKSKYGLE
ncbi:MAG: hypothetical protein AAGF25_02230 [Pseudomonadota bacterium]